MAMALSLVYSVMAIAIGLSYLVFPVQPITGTVQAVTLVVPIVVWGCLFTGAGLLILATLVFHRFQHIAHFLTAVLWTGWTSIIITAVLLKVATVGAPFYVASIMFAHVILAIYYRPPRKF